MSKIWLIGDTHFGYKSDDEIWLNDYISYFEDTLIPIMKERVKSNDILIHCGDVFDNRATVGLETMNRVISLFEQFSDIFSDIRITVGNHDCAKKSSTYITSVNILKHIPNVKIYYDPKVEYIGDKKCLFNPWIEDLEKEKKLLQSVDVDYIFGHLLVGGSKAVGRSGVRSDITSGVSISDFKNAQVYAGHVHIRQDMKNVHYLGNPYHKDRGDIGNVKGITILDIETGETEFIENTTSPKYLRENIYDIINLTVGDIKQRWNKNRIDLQIPAKDCTKCAVDNLRDCLGGCYREFIIIGVNDVDSAENCESANFGMAKTSSEYIDEYLASKDVSEEFRNKIETKIKEYEERMR